MATIDEMAGGDTAARDRMRHEQGRNRQPMEATPKTADPAYRGPGVDIDAERMGGAMDDGATTIEIGPDMVPRRVPRQPPGPQSAAPGSMGELMASTGTDADTLVKMVRQDRLARAAGPSKVPTFGEVSAENRALQAEQAAAQPDPAEEQARIAGIAQSIKFLADTRTGEIEPILPDQEVPQPGPHEIVFSSGEDPSTPNILAQGKRVTPAAISRLSDPKRGVKPALRPGYKVPEQYAGLAEALGLTPPGEEGGEG